MSNDLFVTPNNQNEEKNKKRIEALIGEDKLATILGDIVGSSQSLVDDVYAEKPNWMPVGSDRQPIKYLYAGDPTSDSCVVWVHDPSNDKAYSVKIDFTYVEHLRVK